MTDRGCEDCKHFTKAGNEYPCIACTHNYVDKFEAIGAETKFGEWIPVRERLPEKEGRYIVTYTSGGSTFIGLLSFDPQEEFDAEEWENAVKAYMPLPHPWEGK